MVGHLDDVEVVLDDEHRVAGVNEALQHDEKLANVLEVQARGRLVKDVERLAGLPAVQLLGKLHALSLAARKRRGRLAQAHIAQAHVVQGLELALDGGDGRKEDKGLLHGHLEHVGDRLAAVEHLKRLTVVALAAALLAGHVHVGQEVHLDLDLAVALARLAATARHVEAETAGGVAAGLGLRDARKEVAQVVPQADIGGGVRARRAPDGGLVDVDDLVDELEALEALVGADGAHGALDGVGERRGQRVGDQRAFARTGDARHDREGADGDAHSDVLEVVGSGAAQRDGSALGAAALLGQLDHARSAQVGARKRLRRGGNLRRRASRDHFSSAFAGARAHVHHEVGRTDGVLVVLHHHDRVAQVAQVAQRGDEAVVVSLVKADAGLVEDVEHAHEAGTDLRGQADALRLTARKGRG